MMAYTKTYHSPTILPGGDGPIKLTKPKGDVFVKGDVIRLIPGTTYDYAFATEVAAAIAVPPVAPTAPAVPPAPPPPPAPAGPEIVRNPDGSIYARLGRVVTCVSVTGCPFTVHYLPDGWPQFQLPSGGELGWAGLQIDGIEYPAVPAIHEGALIGYNGKVLTQSCTRITASLIGSNDGLTWTYDGPDMKIVQVTTLTEAGIRRAVTITAKVPLTGLRYARSGEFTPSTSSSTNTPTRVTATGAYQGAVGYTSPDAGAVFGLTVSAFEPRDFTQIATATVPAPLKARSTSPFVAFNLGDLAVGQSKTITFDLGRQG